MELPQETREGPIVYYYVMRTHTISPASKENLYKLVSRRFTEKRSAIDWKDFCESQENNKKHRFFIVEVIDGKDIPYYGQVNEL